MLPALLSRHSSIGVQVKAVRLQQLGCLLNLLQGVPPFAQLPHDKLISLAIFARPVPVLQDSVIAREGDPVDTMYIIQKGLLVCRTAFELPTWVCCSELFTASAQC